MEQRSKKIYYNYPNLSNFRIVIEHLFTVTDGRDGWTKRSSGCWWKLLQKAMVYVKRFVRSHNGINHMNAWKCLYFTEKTHAFWVFVHHEIGNFKISIINCILVIFWWNANHEIFLGYSKTLEINIYWVFPFRNKTQMWKLKFLRKYLQS